MNFKMKSSNNEKCDICQFFYQDVLHIVNIVYVQNFMLNDQKVFEIQHVF